MKNKIFLILVLAAALSGCYKDLGNYDYITLPELKIELPATSYTAVFGDNLSIVPTVKTTIPESDLKYSWELYDQNYVQGSQVQFPYYTIAEGKDLNYNLKKFDFIPSAGTYTFRLRIDQLSNGRFALSDLVSVIITAGGKGSGLVVLHSDGSSSDIGMVVATEFLATDDGRTVETEVIPNYYSSANDGQKIAGRGVEIIQNFHYGASSSYYFPAYARIYVVAITDQTAVCAEYTSMQKQLDWDEMFYHGDDPKINHGKPQYYDLRNTCQNSLAIDDGEVFYLQANSTPQFTLPSISASSGMYMFPGVFSNNFMFDMKGRKFIAFSSYSGDYSTFTNPYTVFDPNDMQADLVYAGEGIPSPSYQWGTGEILAVMKSDNGDRWLAEFDPYDATEDAVFYRYDMSTLKSYNDTKFYAFAKGQVHTLYYATSTDVYRFSANMGVLSQDLATDGRLITSSGQKIELDGTITMLKVLQPRTYDQRPWGDAFVYPHENEILLVGTTKGSVGTLHTFYIDASTGTISRVGNTYTGFGDICDANIKAF